MSGFSFTAEGGAAYAASQAAALNLPADIRDLASTAPDAELLAAVDRDQSLPARLFRAAQSAYHKARRHPLADWQTLDDAWVRMAPRLADLQFQYRDGPPYNAAENAIRVRVVRTSLVALEHFQAVAVPVMSAADQMAARPVPTAVLAARMTGHIHPLDQPLPPPAELEPEPDPTPAALQPAKRRSAA